MYKFIEKYKYIESVCKNKLNKFQKNVMKLTAFVTPTLL